MSNCSPLSPIDTNVPSFEIKNNDNNEKSLCLISVLRFSSGKMDDIKRLSCFRFAILKADHFPHTLHNSEKIY